MIRYDKLIWESDYNGSDLGYPDVSSIGVYTLKNNRDNFVYIDTENHKFIEVEEFDESEIIDQ